MSFRKRNAVISASPSLQAAAQDRSGAQLAPGLRPSPLDGRVTTSTGTASLDGILAGHAGLPLGSSLLIEEQGTTDFSGNLLRYYAAEGLVQGHQVHVLGYPEAWKHELPAVSTKQEGTSGKATSQADDKMKIAWRYENLASRNAPSTAANDVDGSKAVFCHAFDLTKRLASASIQGTLSATPASGPQSFSFEEKEPPSPFKVFIKNLQGRLQNSPPSSVHRAVIPSLLSPTLYSPSACQPAEVLQFLHALRALLRQYCGKLTALITLPVTLFPRNNGVTRWAELLSDGVLEMIPLPPKLGATPASSNSESKVQEQSQGILRVHSLPIFHEKGGGGAENNHFREDLSFHLSGTKGLVIQPYVLPPMEEEDHKEKSPASTVKDDIDF
ncbi:Elongator subunit elp4 [Diaporthe australafricana]|uniref:Elongator complex protein 4 n=1 Tax=Diaporthe australafricana TaxID=127596 RepID=A0ABR3X2E4_9PEZI